MAPSVSKKSPPQGRGRKEAGGGSEQLDAAGIHRLLHHRLVRGALPFAAHLADALDQALQRGLNFAVVMIAMQKLVQCGRLGVDRAEPLRSEEHTSELQSLMRISYAVF